MSYFGMNISSPRTELKHDLDKTQACQAICISLYTVLSYAYTHMTYIYINNEALNRIIIRFQGCPTFRSNWLVFGLSEWGQNFIYTCHTKVTVTLQSQALL